MAPPGVVFLLKSVPRLIYHSIVAYGCLRVFDHVRNVQLSAYAIAIAVLLVNPLLSLGQRVWAQSRNRRKAAAMGAVIAPAVHSRLPFGISHMLNNRRTAKKAMFSELVAILCGEDGVYS